MSTKKTIYIVRHGQTDYNLKGIIQGSGINSHINATGRKQAALFHRHYHDLPFTRIYTSALIRTHQTVQPFTQNGHIVKHMSAFDEIGWGEFEGKESTPEIQNQFYHILGEWSRGNYDLTCAGGETPNEMAARQRIGLEKVMDESGMEDILICSHGRAMKSLFCVLLDIPLSNMDTFKHTNLCLYRFETNDGSNFRMTLRNETSHLKSLSTLV